MTKTAKKPPARKPQKIARRNVPPPPRARPQSRTQPPETPAGTKLARLESALRNKGGATIPDLMEITGWQAHSVRGAIAGALKKRGLEITSERIDGERRYRVVSQR